MYFINMIDNIEGLKTIEGMLSGIEDCTDYTLGYFETLEEAKKSLEDEAIEILGNMYRYALIEKVEPGLYPKAKEEHWFEYDREDEVYKEMENPELIVVNFSMS